MAGFAIDLRDVIGVRVFLDVRVAVAALEAAVDACGELVTIYGDAMAGRVLHCLIGVAGKAVRLCCVQRGPKAKHKSDEAENGKAMTTTRPRQIGDPIDGSGKDGKDESSDTSGSGHALGFLQARVSNCSCAHGSPGGDYPLTSKNFREDCTFEETPFRTGAAVIVVTTATS